jgi:hypothetical protein
MFLEKQEQAKPQISRWKEIIKIRAEINERETKRRVQRLSKTELVHWKDKHDWKTDLAKPKERGWQPKSIKLDMKGG